LAVGSRRNVKPDGIKWKRGERKKYTTVLFASHLFAEGFTKSIVDLRVFACGSGTLDDANRSFAVNPQKHLKKWVITMSPFRDTREI
jgi:hypothetical protein